MILVTMILEAEALILHTIITAIYVKLINQKLILQLTRTNGKRKKLRVV